MIIAGKSVLVTGANRGIGQALVQEALRRGAIRVYASTRRTVSHPHRRVTPRLQSEAIGTLRTSCTTRATSPFRKTSHASVITPGCLPGCARLPTTFCATIRSARSVRTDMPPHSLDLTHSSSGASVESVEQPCPQWGANVTDLKTSHVQRNAWREAGYEAFLVSGSDRVTFRKAIPR